MAAPVWVLSVDLQTKTATFQTGMADAARSARGAFSDIKGGSTEMGEHVNVNMFAARHSVMALTEAFGTNMPRAITAFVAHLGPIGPALEAAFPFAAVGLAAVLLYEHLEKLREAGVKLTEDQIKFKTAIQDAFNSMDEKILQAEKRTDELKGDHLGALHAELQLIDRQTMNDLVAEFEKVAKAADQAFGLMQSHWYSLGIGSSGAKHALDDFQSKYALLLSQGKGEEASGLLTGTLSQAQKVLDAMKQFKDNQADSTTGKKGNYAAAEAAAEVIRQAGLVSKVTGEFTKDELESQQRLVDALQAQLHIQQQAADLNKREKGNARLEEAKADKKDDKALAEAQQKAVDEEGRVIKAANEQMAQDIAQGWREQIDATKEGSAERLAVINAAIADELAQGMESTGAYRELMTARVTVTRQMSEEQEKVQMEGARQAADNDEKMGQLRIAAEKQQMALEDSARRTTAQQRISQEVQIANEEYEIKHNALEAQIEALDAGGNDYHNKLKELQDKERQLYQSHEDEITAIKDNATIARNAKILSAEQKYEDQIASGLTQSIMGHETWSKMLIGFGNEVVSSLIQQEIKHIEANLLSKESDAGHAARKAFNIGLEMGGPAGMVLGPIFAAGAFASVMAFQHGTDRVPGIGHGDVVPTMLEPGEGVVPGGVMDGLRSMARSGGLSGGGTHYHAHVSPVYNLQAIDTTGVENMLQEHNDTLTKHVENTLRKLNK